MNNNIIDKFMELINEPDEKGAPYKGPDEAVIWIKKLSSQDRATVFNYIDNVLLKSQDRAIKIIFVKILPLIGGSDSLDLLSKVIFEGQDKYGDIVGIAIDAKNKLLNRIKLSTAVSQH